MNELLNSHHEEVERILAKYPPEHRRSAVMPLLLLSQRQGFITRQSISDIAGILDISTTEVASIVGFYTLFHEEESPGKGGARYRIQVCTDLPCTLRGVEDFLEELCERLEVEVGETTPDGLFVVEEVMCLAACHRAPMFQFQGDGRIDYHEEQTIETVLALIDGLRVSAEAERGKKEMEE